MFREDEKTGLPKKLTQKERMLTRRRSDSPTKRKAKSTGKRSDGRPTRKLQTSGMSLQAEIPAGTSKSNNNNITQPTTPDTDNNEDDNQSSASSEDITPSPKRQSKKQTPLANAAEPVRKSTRNRQSALSRAFGNPVLINTIEEKNDEEKKQPIKFQIDSPPDKQRDNYPHLKTLIQEMGFMEKTPQYRACVKLREIISPRNKTGHTEIVDLTSPPIEEEASDTNNEILFIIQRFVKKAGWIKTRKMVMTRNTKARGEKMPSRNYKQKNDDATKSHRDYKTQTY